LAGKDKLATKGLVGKLGGKR